MAYTGEVALDGGAPAKASIEVGEDTLSIAGDAGAVQLPYVDIEDVHDDNYTLRLTDPTGRRTDLSMLGKAYGQLLAEVTKARDAALERDLLLKGVRLQDSFPGKLFGGESPVPVQLRVYEDLLVVVPERGTMFGVPFSTITGVDWNEELYQTTVHTDEGESHVFGHLARRSEEFRDELRRLLDALAARTARTLGALLPGLTPAALSALAGVMRDGRAVQKRRIDAIDPAIWPQLEGVVAGSDARRASYDHLAKLAPEGWQAFGIKAVRSEPGDEPEEAPTDPDPALEEGAPLGTVGGEKVSDLWYFCPLTADGRPANAVAQEVTSETGHATYVFRLLPPERFAQLSGDVLADEVERAIARLNRALLLLNFRREPLYAREEEMQTGRFARYRVALRKLDYLRWAREALLGRAVHNATWEEQVAELAAKA